VTARRIGENADRGEQRGERHARCATHTGWGQPPGKSSNWCSKGTDLVKAIGTAHATGACMPGPSPPTAFHFLLCPIRLKHLPRASAVYMLASRTLCVPASVLSFHPALEGEEQQVAGRGGTVNEWA